MILNGCCILNYKEQAMEKFRGNTGAGLEDNGESSQVPEYTALQCPSCNTIHHAATFIHEVERRRKLPHHNPYHINRLERYTEQRPENSTQHHKHDTQVYSVKLHNIGFACLVAVLGSEAADGVALQAKELADTNAGDILCVRVRATSPEHAMQLAIKERFGSGDSGPTMYGTFRNECNYIPVSAVTIPSRNGRPLSRNFNS